MGGRPRAGQNTSELGRGGCACWAEGSSPRPASRSWKRGTIGRRAGEEAALTLGGKGGESGVVPGQRGGVRVLRAGQRVVVPREGGRGAQHAVGQLRAQVGAVGRGAHGHPVQGVGAAREGKVHPPVHQVLCRDRAGSLPQARPQTPEPRGAGCRSPGNSGGYLPTYLPGPPWHQNTQPPSAHQGRGPWRSPRPNQPPQASGTQVPWPGRRPPRTRPPPGPRSPSSRPRPGESPHACPGVPWLWGHRARQPGRGGLWLEPRWVRVGACRSPPSPLAPRVPPSAPSAAAPSPGGPESEERRLPADRRGMSSGGSRHVTRLRSSSSPSRGSNFQPQP